LIKLGLQFGKLRSVDGPGT